MALSDLAVFSETMYSTTTEILQEQVNLFNAASRGTIILNERPFAGDFSDTAFFAAIDGLVRRRDPRGDGDVAKKSLRHIIDTMVKIGAGTPPLDISPSQFLWIQQNPDIAGATWAKQLAEQIMKDMLDVAIGSTRAALSQVAAVTTNVTGNTPPDDKATHRNMNLAVSKFGDHGGDILAWVMHSTPLYDIYDQGLQNGASLFSYGTINIGSDPFGRPFIISDNGNLMAAGTPPTFYNLGLTAGAVMLSNNNDYVDNVDTRNGKENIERTMQSEWSYNVGVKGFAWDKATGGEAPTNAALFTPANWDRYSTSHKDLAGVLLITH